MSEGIEWLKGQLEKEAEWIFCSQDDSALQDDDIEYLCSQNTHHIKVLNLSNSFFIQIIASLLLEACCTSQKPIGTNSLRYHLVLII
jgi:1,4-dihydroxy-2-naphthoyl-CoA synthase